VNVYTKTGVYHYPGSRWYGHTKQGKYIKESDAITEGDRSAETERTGARKLAAKRPLQDLCSKQVAHNEEVTEKTSSYTLQDLLLREPALLVGLISTMTQNLS